MTRPDYTRIAELEIELGLVEPEPPRRPVIPAKVCLTKNCDGDTEHIYSWRHPDHPMRSIHTCRPSTT